MTDVLVRLTAPSSGAVASGWVPADEVAAVGHLECRPWAPDADGARLHLEAPDRLLLPASMPPVRLVAGEATLHLAPTGAGWCWQIIERTPRGKTRYVLVPDSLATLDYGDLIDVDPTTLAATAAAVPAWEAAVALVNADMVAASDSASAASGSASTASTKAGEASASASSASGSASTATTKAGEASASASSASGSASTATTKAGEASASASSASGSASTATTQAANASTSAATATTQAGIATTKAAEAATSAANAASSAANAAAVLAGAQPVDADLTAVAGLTSTGLVARTGAGTAAARTITGTANKVTVTNGDGVAGNPTITIPDAPTLVVPTLTAVTPAPTYGPELAPTIDTWTGAAGATYAAPNWVIPSGGTISTTISVMSGVMYQIEMTRTGSSGGLMTVALGTATAGIPADGNSKLTLTAAETGAVTLTIGGGAWACATISAVTVKAVTALASARTAGIVTRALSANNAVGSNAQRALTTGDFNNAVGHDAQRALTTGSSNNAVGYAAQYSLTTGSSNNALGRNAGYSLTTGSYNNVLGHNAGYSLTTGSYNNALGHNAGNSDSITVTVATVSYATMLGHNAQATVSNVAVIGSALAAERQTLCLGNYNALGSNVRGGFALSNAQTIPTTNPTGGGILYAEAGALKWRGSSGTVTTIAAA